MEQAIDKMRPKEPLMAVMLSTILPGMGQCYVGRIKRGFLFFFIPLALHFFMILYFLSPKTRWNVIFHMFPLVLIGFVIFVIVDAYRCAKGYNQVYGLQRTAALSKKIFFIALILSFSLLINPPILIMKGIDSYIENNIASTFMLPTDAMEPTIRKGERILVAKNSYKNADPERGDVVAFRVPPDSNKLRVKRVVGLPGESLQIKDGALFVDGKKIDRSPFSSFYYHNAKESGYGKFGQIIEVPKDSYFVLGDNSAHSWDSKHYGFIPKKDLVGKAYKIYMPFERSGEIK